MQECNKHLRVVVHTRAYPHTSSALLSSAGPYSQAVKRCAPNPVVPHQLLLGIIGDCTLLSIGGSLIAIGSIDWRLCPVASVCLSGLTKPACGFNSLCTEPRVSYLVTNADRLGPRRVARPSHNRAAAIAIFLAASPAADRRACCTAPWLPKRKRCLPSAPYWVASSQI